MKKFLLTLLLALAVGTGAAWAETVTYKLVTDAADIQVGAEYIIVYDTGTLTKGRWIWALGAQSGNVRKAVDVTITDNTVTIDPTTVSPVTLRESTNNDYPYLLGVVDDTDEAYLYNASTSNRITTTTDATTANAACSISLSSSTSTIKYPNGYYLQCYYTGGSKADVSGQQFSCYKGTQKNPMLFKREGQETPEPQPLEKVTLEGADENGNISVEQGATLKFSAPNAAMYEITGDIEANDFVKNGKFEYVVTFPEGKDVLNITVTPYDEDLETLDGTASTFTITKIAAPDCGELTFTPASGTAITAGSTITLSADNAVIYRYGINTEAESEFSEGASFTVSENDFIDGKCTVRAYPMNSDGKRGETIMAEYTLKVAERYALVNNLAHVKKGTKYIIAAGYDIFEETTNAFADVSSKQASSVVVAAISENIIVPGEAKVNYLELTNISTSADGTTCKIKLANGDYLSAKSSETDLTTSSSGSDFTVSFDANGSFDAKTGSREILFLNSSKIFKNYASSNKTNSSYSPVYLYRLIDDEYDTEVPEELYIHGHFYDRYYDLDNPDKMDLTGDKVFSRTNFYIGGNVEHTDKPLTYVFTTHKPAESAARSHVTSDWARITEGNVYHQGGKTAAANVDDGHEITPFSVEKPGYYTITADFSGYAPVVTATAQADITTGIENVEASDANAPVEYYNLQGVRIAKPTSGIVIRRQGKSVTKVFVK